jgi:hypothetical protein
MLLSDTWQTVGLDKERWCTVSEPVVLLLLLCVCVCPAVPAGVLHVDYQQLLPPAALVMCGAGECARG